MEKSALVLSAGGSFGAYQVGAWRELSRWFTPDIVIGTSVGSLNAWAIAGGADAGWLERMWRDPALAPEFRFGWPQSWRSGILRSDKAETVIRNLHAHWRPVREVGIVLTAVRGLRQRLFQGEQVGWEHLAGSCAIPFFLPMPKIGGQVWADGGLFDSVNEWAAVEMGATRVITVDCWRPRGVPVLDWGVGWLADRRRHTALSPVRQVPVQRVLIEPAGPLGSMMDTLRWDPGRLDEWMELGARDAREKKQFFRDMF